MATIYMLDDLIDSDSTTNLIYKHLCENHVVMCFKQVSDIMKEIEKAKPDIILFDIRMSDDSHESGLDLYLWLEDGLKSKSICFSAFTDDPNVKKVHKLGVRFVKRDNDACGQIDCYIEQILSTIR